MLRKKLLKLQDAICKPHCQRLDRAAGQLMQGMQQIQINLQAVVGDVAH